MKEIITKTENSDKSAERIKKKIRDGHVNFQHIKK
jgi:hypothetical protein